MASLEYTLAILQLSNPNKWSPDAVKLRLITAADFDAIFTSAATTTSGIPNKFSFKHDTKGSNYSAFFTTPPAPASKSVKVTIKRVVALGSVKDTENGLADHVVTVSIQRPGDGAFVTRALKKDANDVSPNWTASRKMVPEKALVRIRVDLTEHDDKREVVACPGHQPYTVCYCGDTYKPYPEPVVAMRDYDYKGPCKDTTHEVDINPKTKSISCNGALGCRSMELDYDMLSGKITGDASGKRGDVLTVTGIDPTRKARIELTVD